MDACYIHQELKASPILTDWLAGWGLSIQSYASFPTKSSCQKSQSSTSRWLRLDSRLARAEGESCGWEPSKLVMGDTGCSSSGSASEGRRFIWKQQRMKDSRFFFLYFGNPSTGWTADLLKVIFQNLFTSFTVSSDLKLQFLLHLLHTIKAMH